MKISIEGKPKEIAALVLELQERQSIRPKFVPETADGPIHDTKRVAMGASQEDILRYPCQDTNTNCE